MSGEESIAALGEWEGYGIGSVDRFEAKEPEGREEVWIELLASRDFDLVCSSCGRASDKVHDYTERWVRDLPILGATTSLLVHRRRVACDQCGPRLERLSWLSPYSRVTTRLAESVARLCQVASIKHVAEFFGLSWDVVKRIDKAYLKQKLGPVDLSGLDVVAVDEFALHRGHRYATVVVNPRNKQVLWVGPGKGREAMRAFLEKLGPQGRSNLQAVVMDMNGAYAVELREQCPHVEIVYDLFHVVAKYGREVIDRVRVDEANRLREDRRARRVIKGARWLLLRNRENLANEEEAVRLEELLAANKKLLTVYVLKEDLKHLWDYTYPAAALRFWKRWYSRAVRSRIEPLKRFAQRLKAYLHGIISHCRWPLHTSLLEGINNRIKVIKRMAYGFRDQEYFFLKIRAAFPGNRG